MRKNSRPLRAVRPAKLVRPSGSWEAGERVLHLELPVRVMSLANKRLHWSKLSQLAKEQKAQLAFWLMRMETAAGADVSFRSSVATVTLVHLFRGGHPLDDDNLAGAFKYVRDTIASWLGTHDGPGGRVRFFYAQRRQGEVGIEVFLNKGVDDGAGRSGAEANLLLGQDEAAVAGDGTVPRVRKGSAE